MYAFALARELGFPPISIRPGVSVLGTEDAWRQFARRAAAIQLKRAITALELKGEELTG